MADIEDVKWVSGVWLAIHGGDPGPDGEGEPVLSGMTATLGALFLGSLAADNDITPVSGEGLLDALRSAGIAPHEDALVCLGQWQGSVDGGPPPGANLDSEHNGKWCVPGVGPLGRLYIEALGIHPPEF
jgi:hypothetical protein